MAAPPGRGLLGRIRRPARAARGRRWRWGGPASGTTNTPSGNNGSPRPASGTKQRRGLDGQRRLPAAAEADERNQAARRVGRAAGHQGQLLVPPHEAGGPAPAGCGAPPPAPCGAGRPGGGLRRGVDAGVGGTRRRPRRRVAPAPRWPLRASSDIRAWWASSFQGSSSSSRRASAIPAAGTPAAIPCGVPFGPPVAPAPEHQAQTLRLQGEPLVELRRVAQVLHRRGTRRGRDRARPRPPRPLRADSCTGDLRLKLGHVDPVGALAVEGHPLPGHV